MNNLDITMKEEGGSLKRKIQEFKVEWDNLFKEIVKNIEKRDYTKDGSKKLKEERMKLWEKRRDLEAKINDLENRLNEKKL